MCWQSWHKLGFIYRLYLRLCADVSLPLFALDPVGASRPCFSSVPHSPPRGLLLALCVSGGARNPRSPGHALQYVENSSRVVFHALRGLFWCLTANLPNKCVCSYLWCFWLFFNHVQFRVVFRKEFCFFYAANQPESKVCIHGYLFPLPVALGQVPHPSYDPTAGDESCAVCSDT